MLSYLEVMDMNGEVSVFFFCFFTNFKKRKTYSIRLQFFDVCVCNIIFL